MKFKAVYDKTSPTGNLVTTISGIVTLIVTILVGFGIIKPEHQADVQSQSATIINAVITIWGAVSGLILVFKAKD